VKNKFFALLFLFSFTNPAYSDSLSILNSTPENGSEIAINEEPDFGDIMFDRDISPSSSKVILVNLEDNTETLLKLREITSSIIISFDLPDLTLGEYKIIWSAKICYDFCFLSADRYNSIPSKSGEFIFKVVEIDSNYTIYKIFISIFLVFIIIILLLKRYNPSKKMGYK